MKGIIKISVLLTLFISDIICAQDTLVLKNNSKLPVEISEIGLTDIKYKSYSDPYGTIFSINKSEVEGINYSDGYKQKIVDNDTNSPNKLPRSLFLQGQVDAAHFYQGYRAASTSTLIVSLISPIVGLVPAVICSTTKPKQKKLDYPDSQLFHELDYQRGYISQSKRIKSKKVWRNWGIAFAVNVALVIFIQ